MKAKLNDPVSKAHSEQFERFVLAVLKVRTSSFCVKNWQYGAFVLRFESEYANNKQKSQPLSDWLFPSWGTRNISSKIGRNRVKTNKTKSICKLLIYSVLQSILYLFTFCKIELILNQYVKSMSKVCQKYVKNICRNKTLLYLCTGIKKNRKKSF